jgi:phosphodiesterase/alkaline phosphatase D-like protein
MTLLLSISFISNFELNDNSTLSQVILLDTRYHRDPLLSDGTILGDPQWQWLERELHGPQSEITVIGSSIQVNLLFHMYIPVEDKPRIIISVLSWMVGGSPPNTHKTKKKGKRKRKNKTDGICDCYL